MCATIDHPPAAAFFYSATRSGTHEHILRATRADAGRCLCPLQPALRAIA